MISTNKTLTAKNLRHWAGGRPKVVAIILHDTAGSGTASDAEYLAHDPEHRGISVDFCVLRDGTIYQLNPDPTQNTTAHAGRHTQLSPTITNANVNAHSIGIELAHKADPSKQLPLWPMDQVKAVAELCRDLCTQFNLTRENITTHAKVITDGSRSDPRDFDWNNFWTCFAGESPAPRPTDGNPVPNTQVYHEVKAGETLWGLANQYHTTIEAIKALNHFDSPSTLITVGQKLLVQA